MTARAYMYVRIYVVHALARMRIYVRTYLCARARAATIKYTKSVNWNLDGSAANMYVRTCTCDIYKAKAWQNVNDH